MSEKILYINDKLCEIFGVSQALTMPLRLKELEDRFWEEYNLYNEDCIQSNEMEEFFQLSYEIQNVILEHSIHVSIILDNGDVETIADKCMEVNEMGLVLEHLDGKTKSPWIFKRNGRDYVLWFPGIIDVRIV